MDNVCEQIVVTKTIFGVDLLVVDGQGAVQNAPLLQQSAIRICHIYSEISICVLELKAIYFLFCRSTGHRFAICPIMINDCSIHKKSRQRDREVSFLAQT